MSVCGGGGTIYSAHKILFYDSLILLTLACTKIFSWVSQTGSHRQRMKHTHKKNSNGDDDDDAEMVTVIGKVSNKEKRSIFL